MYYSSLERTKRNTFGTMSASNVSHIMSGREEAYVKHNNGKVTTDGNFTNIDGTVVSNYVSMPAPNALSLEKSRETFCREDFTK